MSSGCFRCSNWFSSKNTDWVSANKVTKKTVFIFPECCSEENYGLCSLLCGHYLLIMATKVQSIYEDDNVWRFLRTRFKIFLVNLFNHLQKPTKKHCSCPKYMPVLSGGLVFFTFHPCLNMRSNRECLHNYLPITVDYDIELENFEPNYRKFAVEFK